jgi:hypothetical protein
MRCAKMTPEEKVATAIGMSTVVTQVCADGIKDSDPEITEEELLHLLRGRRLAAKGHGIKLLWASSNYS